MQVPEGKFYAYRIFRAMAILVSVAIVLTAQFSASELKAHIHTYIIEEIREPDEETRGQISLYCPECGQYQIYSLGNASDPEPLDPETTKAILRLFFSSIEPSGDDPAVYSLQSDHAVRNVILALCLLFLLIFLIFRKGR